HGNKGDRGKKGVVSLEAEKVAEPVFSALSVSASNETEIQSKLSELMSKRRRKSWKDKIAERETLKSQYKLGKFRMSVVPQNFGKQLFALFQVDLKEEEQKEFYSSELFITLYYDDSSISETVYRDFGPFTLFPLEDSKKAVIPFVVPLDGIPRGVSVRIEIRSNFRILFEEQYKIPKERLNEIAINIEDFLIEDTLGPTRFYAKLLLGEKYKGLAQLLAFSQIGMIKIWEKRLQTREDTHIELMERVLIPAKIHTGRVAFGLVLEGKSAERPIWDLVEIMPKSPIVVWRFIGFEGPEYDELRADTRYQFLPEVVFNAIVRSPEMSFFLTQDDDPKSKKLVLKERIKDVTYPGMLKVLGKRIDLRLKQMGWYQISLEITCPDDRIPANIVSRPYRFLIS
ncbi:MAG TPA: hypothetical protein VJ044_07165, partial [Candidatus Hodarchaeales archaeon]|nr:hypothetical protein [Candidatus Hodarchaeales archaeon]